VIVCSSSAPAGCSDGSLQAKGAAGWSRAAYRRCRAQMHGSRSYELSFEVLAVEAGAPVTVALHTADPGYGLVGVGLPLLSWAARRLLSVRTELLR